MSLWNKLFGRKEEPASPPQPGPSSSPPKKAEAPPSVPAQPPTKDNPLTPKTLSYRKRNIATGPTPFGRQTDLVSPTAGDSKSGIGANIPSIAPPASPVNPTPTPHSKTAPTASASPAAASLPRSSSASAHSRPSPAPSAHPAKPFPTINPDDPSAKREIRVFISSTFRDMQEERELLVKKVFPELRRICDERFVSFTEVDLRWGITEEEAAEGKVLPICLEEIHTCRPYFIGILGERYGWIPDTVPQEVLDKEPWIQEHIGHRTSVTELEILHGVLCNPEMDGHAFFYFRDPAYAVNRGEDFQTEDPDSAAKLAALKETIRHSGRPLVDTYKKPDELASAVKQQFIELIDQLYPKEQVPDPLDQEAIGHRAYARQKLLACIERPACLAVLNHFATAPADGQGLVVTGESGGGKTAFLAAWASSIIHHPSSFLFEHYFGATPDSATVPRFLRRLLGELKRRADIPDEIPSDPTKMAEALPLWIAQSAGKIPRLILALDALNQVEGEHSDRNLSWLPRFFPEHVQVIASALPGPALDTLTERGWTDYPLPPPDARERGEMIDAYLSKTYRKTPSSPIREALIHAPGCANPLFLRTVMDEFRQFGDFDHLLDKVAEYLKAENPVALFRQVIHRWQKDFHAGRDLVARSLRCLWAARQGLAENEWLDLLADSHGDMDRQTWRPLFLALAPHLVQRDGLWALGHDYLKQAITLELLPNEALQQQAHLVLADYFEDQPIAPRSTIELPHQLQNANSKDRLRACLLDIDRFLLMHKRDDNELMRYWVWLKEERKMGQPYVKAFEQWSTEKCETTSVSYTANQLAYFLSLRAALHTEAEPLLRRALDIDEASFGKDHSMVATMLNNLALLLRATNRPTEAEPIIRRSLAISEQSLGRDDPNVATCLNNLALLLQDTNRLSEAEPLMRRSLAIDEASLGKDHPKVATNLNNLAQLMQKTNRLSQAESLMRRSLAIDEHSFGPDHPNVARDVNNLAGLLRATNRLDEAELLYRRALDIFKKSLGSDHPDLAASLNNLAQLLEATNRLAEAEALYRRALTIDEASLGKDHPNVAIKLSNLAQLLQATNRLAEAEPLTRRALAIDEASFGKNHPHCARDLSNLAQLLQDTNRLAEAEPMMRRALVINEASYGPDHPNVARCLNNLALLLQGTNRLAEAEPLLRRALAIEEQSYGMDHPDVAISLNSLAQLLQGTNRLAEAEPLMRRVIKIFEQSHGENHPKVAASLNNLAVLFYITKRLAEVEPLMRRALAIDEQSFGREHPDVASDLYNLVGLLQATNRLAEAEPLMQRAVEIVLKCNAATGHPHLNQQTFVDNYAGLLRALGRSGEEIESEMSALAGRYGLASSGSGVREPQSGFRANIQGL